MAGGVGGSCWWSKLWCWDSKKLGSAYELFILSTETPKLSGKTCVSMFKPVLLPFFVLHSPWWDASVLVLLQYMLLISVPAYSEILLYAACKGDEDGDAQDV